MTILLILLTLSLGEAAKSDRTYLPPPGSMLSASNSRAAEDSLVPGRIQSIFPETTDESIPRNESIVRYNESETMYGNQMQSENTEEFKTESPTNHLKELSTPFFYNRFKVPEDLLLIKKITNQNTEISQDSVHAKEDSDKQNYASNYVLDKKDLTLSKSNFNQKIYSSFPGTDLQPQVQLLDPKSKTDVNIFSDDIVKGSNKILSTTDRALMYSSTSSNSATSLNPPFDMKVTSIEMIPNNSVNIKPIRPRTEADRNAYILKYKNRVNSDTFTYGYDTSNGIYVDQSGTAADGVRVQGSYSYTGDDGKLYTVVYTADENGFQPHGDHLPTPPPIPEAILKVIKLAAENKEQGLFDDGSYNVNKYGDDKYNYGYRRQRLPNENKGVVNGGDLPSAYESNYYFAANANQLPPSGENVLATFRNSNRTEGSKKHILSGVATKEKKIHGLSFNASSQPVITDSRYKISVVDNNEMNLHKNKEASVDLINPVRAYPDDSIMIKADPYMSKIDERKGYYYDRPQKRFEVPKRENVFANEDYVSSKNGDINISVSDNSKIKVLRGPNKHFKVPTEQTTDSVIKINEKIYDNTFSLSKGYSDDTYYPSSFTRKILGNDVVRQKTDSFHSVTADNLLQNPYTLNTATENYNSLPNSTPLDTTESFTTFPTTSIDESIISTILPIDKQKNELGDNVNNLILKTPRTEYDREEKHVDGHSGLNTVPFAGGTETTSEHIHLECSSPGTTTFAGSPNEPTLPYNKSYATKSSLVKIIGEDFAGPKQPTKYDSNYGYYY